MNKIMENIEELIPRGVKHMWIMTQEKHPHEFFSEMKTTYEVGITKPPHQSSFRVLMPLRE